MVSRERTCVRSVRLVSSLRPSGHPFAPLRRNPRAIGRCNDSLRPDPLLVYGRPIPFSHPYGFECNYDATCFFPLLSFSHSLFLLSLCYSSVTLQRATTFSFSLLFVLNNALLLSFSCSLEHAVHTPRSGVRCGNVRTGF